MNIVSFNENRSSVRGGIILKITVCHIHADVISFQTSCNGAAISACGIVDENAVKQFPICMKGGRASNAVAIVVYKA